MAMHEEVAPHPSSFILHPSNDAVQRPAGGGQLVDAAGDLGVFDQGRGMTRLAAGVNHQRADAAPMLVDEGRLDPVSVRSRIAAGERGPEEVVERSGGEL